MNRKKIYTIIALVGIIVLILILFIRYMQKKEESLLPEVKKTAPAIMPPTVPAMIQDVMQQRVYYTLHFWDNFNFQDTLYLHQKEMVNQAFSAYIVNLIQTDSLTARKSIENVIERSAGEESGLMLSMFLELYDDYFYGPNSPFRNEELYIVVLEKVLKTDGVDDIYLVRPRFQYDRIILNRAGRKANDFQYTTIQEKNGSLYKITADYILIFFYNPDCSACKAELADLQNQPLIQDLIKTGKMKVLAFYPDSDLTAWQEHAGDIPKEWINAADPTGKFSKEKIYDIRAIPSLYLLDKSKKVILKDATPEQIYNWLFIHTQ